ncbi:MAG: ATP-dependent DNA ligase [Nitrososphaerales archaeon]
MSDALPNYVSNNYARAVRMDVAEWIFKNPLPAICEPKYDGIRVFLFKSGDNLIVSGKIGTVFTPKSHPLVFSKIPEFLHAPYRMILDGEYVSKDTVHLFDVIQVDKRDVRSLILEERKKILGEILEGTNLEVESERAKSEQEIFDLKEEYVGKGFEGLVLKNPLSTYGQANSWLKLKRFDTIDCFVIDYEDTPEGKRSGIPRSWFVGLYDQNGEVMPIGKVGSFVESVDPRTVTKGSVIEVRFQEVTDDKKLRAPFILRVRRDKPPQECSYLQLEKV